jgi:hypothetical protein
MVNPLAMQIVHVLIAAAVVFTFQIAAPFGRIIKTLFTFGYFPFFEYATISRNYSPVFLFFLLGAAVVSMRQPRPILLAIVLALLAQVSIWGAGFAALLMFVAIVQWKISGKVIVAALIVLASCVAAYLESIPGPGRSYIVTWVPGATTWEKFMGSVGTVWKGWMPLPLWQRVWWNTNVLDDYYVTHFVLACALLVIAILCFLKRPLAGLLLIVGLAAQMAFTYFEFCGFTRHHGQLFMVLIVACWIAPISPQRMSAPAWASWFDAKRNLLLGLLLAVHAIVGVAANVANNLLPFSAGKATAEYIHRELPANITLVGVDDYTMSPIATYLHREFYFPQMKRFAPFNTQDDRQRFHASPEQIFQEIQDLLVRTETDVLFVRSNAMVIQPEEFTFTIPASMNRPQRVIHVSLLNRLTDSTIPDETYSLYLFHRVQ